MNLQLVLMVVRWHDWWSWWMTLLPIGPDVGVLRWSCWRVLLVVTAAPRCFWKGSVPQHRDREPSSSVTSPSPSSTDMEFCLHDITSGQPCVGGASYRSLWEELRGAGGGANSGTVEWRMISWWSWCGGVDVDITSVFRIKLRNMLIFKHQTQTFIVHFNIYT